VNGTRDHQSAPHVADRPLRRPREIRGVDGGRQNGLFVIEGVSVARRTGSAERAGDVLIVDDNENLRTLLRATPEGAGHKVVEAADGKEALRRARSGPRLALILLDLDTPVLDGPGFAAAYRVGPSPHVPVVVMSASTDGPISRHNWALRAISSSPSAFGCS
jgi:CheY-like chemotaxis protein